jgi:hypothetical protein
MKNELRTTQRAKKIILNLFSKLKKAYKFPISAKYTFNINKEKSSLVLRFDMYNENILIRFNEEPEKEYLLTEGKRCADDFSEELRLIYEEGV